MNLIERLIAWTERQDSRLGLDLMRVIVGLMAIRHLVAAYREWHTLGFYGDFFHLPYFTWWIEPNEFCFLALLVVGILAGAGMVAGFATRAMTIVCASVTTYHFMLNEVWYRHNRYFLVLLLGILCWVPGKTWNLRNNGAANHSATLPHWPTFLIKMQMTLIYLASASSKSMDESWRSGAVLEVRGFDQLWSKFLPQDIVTMLTDLMPEGMTSTHLALATEYILAILLWLPKTTRLAFWVGVIFHGFIEVTASVATFSYLTLATYFVFANLRPHAKSWVTPQRGWYWAILRGVVRALDWAIQVKVDRAPLQAPIFVDAKGQHYTGLSAWICLGANLLPSFIFFYPLHLLVLAQRRFRTFEVPRLSEGWVDAMKGATKPASPWWWVVVFVPYFWFVYVINGPGDNRVPFEETRFWDMPWYFAIMCLVALTWRGGASADEVK